MLDTAAVCDKQPEWAAPLDFTNKFAKRLKYALIASVPVELVTRQALTFTPGPVVRTPSGDEGLLARGVAGATNAVAYLSIPTSALAGDVTLFFVAEVKYNYAGGTNVLGGLANSAGNQFFGLQAAPGAGNNTFTIRQTNGGGTTIRQFSANNLTVNTDNPAVLACRQSGTSTLDVFWDGVLDNGILTTGSSGSSSWDRLAIGGVVRSSVLGAQELNACGAVFVIPEFMSDEDIAEFSANLWQAFAVEELIGVINSAPVASGITGVASITLDNVVASATGQLPITGIAAITLAPVTVAAVGALPITGQTAIQLADIVVAAEGSSATTGQAAIQLGDVTVSASGSLPISGQAAVQLAAVTVSAVGALPIGGQTDIALDPVTVASTGVFGDVISGQASILLGPVTVAATGQLSIEGQAPVQLADVVVSATGQLAISSAATITLDDFSVIATGHNAAGPPALTNDQMQELYLWMSELHLIHGLRAGFPLSVTQTTRAAGPVSQAVGEAAGTVTVERL